MPITLPADLPAYTTLRDEGVMVMDEGDAARQDIRPLRIALLNLMPRKIQTETQFARLVGATPLQIDLHLIRMTEHISRNTEPSHMEAFYRPFADVVDQKFDGLILTGAPIEHLAFEDVTYWDEMRRVIDWTTTNVHHSFGVCWGGMAMMYHLHGIPKHMMAQKLFGLYRHDNLDPSAPWLRGFSDDCIMPVSRWTEVHQTDIDAAEGMVTLLASPEAGPALVDDPDNRALYVFNHFEYDADTLAQEHRRDRAAGIATAPLDYYPGDDPERAPPNRWRSHAHLLYGNWINRIYQTTPYDLDRIGG